MSLISKVFAPDNILARDRLSYRKKVLFDRPLTKDEVRYVQGMARRIAAIVLLQPTLDANYESTKQHPPVAFEDLEAGPRNVGRKRDLE